MNWGGVSMKASHAPVQPVENFTIAPRFKRGSGCNSDHELGKTRKGFRRHQRRGKSKKRNNIFKRPFTLLGLHTEGNLRPLGESGRLYYECVHSEARASLHQRGEESPRK